MRHNLSPRENGRGETAHRVVRTDHSDHSFRGLMADMAAMAARYETLQEDEVIVPSGKGHTDASAAAAMEKWGKNEIPEEKEPLWKMFVMQFVGTMPAMVRHAPRPSHDAPHRKAAHHALPGEHAAAHKCMRTSYNSQVFTTLARRLRSPACSPSPSGRTWTSGSSSPCS